MKKRHLKIILIFISFLIAGSAVAVAAIGKSAKESGSRQADANASPLAKQGDIPAAIIDTDGDGIYDWEEILAGTDPNTPDKEKFDAIKTAESSGSSTGSFDPQTLTEEASVSFFSQFLSAKRAGGTFGKKDMQGFVKEAESQVLNYDKSFRENDFLVYEAENKSSLKDYLNSVASVFLSGDGVGSENELSVFIKFAQNGGTNPEDLRALEKHAENYEGVVGGLLETAVPDSLSVYHISMTQAAYNTKHTLSVLSQMEELDLMVFIIAGQAYNQNTTIINKRLHELVDFAKQYGISFDINDPFSRLSRELTRS